MKRFVNIFVLLLITHFTFANLLYNITDGKYRPKLTDLPKSMTDSRYYSEMVNNKAVVEYNYKTGATIDTLFSVTQVKKCPIKSITGYILSPDETKMLVYTDVKYRYRRTFTADYYLYDIKTKKIQPLSDGGPEEVPEFSPNSQYIVFARNNNLFMYKIDYNTEIAITKDGQKNKIINGTPDWVYEEEFETTRYFTWSPDSKLVAFLKFNETKVPEFTFPKYDAWSKDINLYPGVSKVQYPKAGENNPIVTVCVYDEYNQTIRTMKLPDTQNDYYIPRIKWTKSPDELAIFKMNRNQNRLDMIIANPRSTECKLILRQTDKDYVDFENIDYTHFTSDNKFFFMVSEKDGYRHIYEYRMDGTPYKEITKGNWDITDFYGYDEIHKKVYYQSAETSPLKRDIYCIDKNGKKTRLTNGDGTHSAIFNSDFSMFVDHFSSLTTPDELTLKTDEGKTIRQMENNSKIETEVKDLNLPHKEFFSFTTPDSIKLNGWMLKPLNFDKNKKYPVLMVQYSGPNSQEVLDKWSYGWEFYLAKHGYIVACVDGRGTGARGAEFRKCTYEKMGILETKDQISTAKYLGSLSYVNKDRIGIWGWSFGGSMTLWAMSTGEKVFKAGIAVAPVTDWRLYDTAYTERYMRTPQENYKGYNETSALNMASKLNGKLLIIHGTADDNVHFQNTMLYVAKLIDAGKQFDMMVYPDKTHSLLGKKIREHLYTKMSDFLFQNL